MTTVSIMITTKNRSLNLKKTLGVLRALDPQPQDILITADGCSDNTVEMVQRDFPSTRLIINEKGTGSVASRDRMMRETRGDLILALDDDSYPEQTDCLKTLQDYFEKNPKLAVATFPQRTDEYPMTLIQEYFGEDYAIRSFPCSGACIRVSTYRSLRGFEPIFYHMYEEPDFALQCVAAGWEVIFTPVITIRHHWSGTGRSEIRNHHLHARNELWSTIMRCPFPQMLGMIVWRILSQARFAATRGVSWLIKEPLWWLDAVKGLSGVWRLRKPVKWAEYKKWLSLPS